MSLALEDNTTLVESHAHHAGDGNDSSQRI
jgi:hypothetical protein